MEDLYNSVLNSLEEAIVIIRPCGDILFANSSWQQWLKDLQLPEDMADSQRYFTIGERFFTHSGGFNASCRRVCQTVLDEQTPRKLAFQVAGHHDEPRFELTVSPLEAEAELLLLVHRDLSHARHSENCGYQLNRLDAQTGLSNLRHFEEFLAGEWQRAVRNGDDICLLRASISGFAESTRHWPASDRDSYLKAIAQLFSRRARRVSDLAARLDDDVFSLVLGRTNRSDGEQLASALLEEFNDLSQQRALEGVRLSIGIAANCPTLIDTPQALQATVSQALSEAQQSQQSPIYSIDPAIRVAPQS